MLTPIITEMRPGLFKATYQGDGWSLSAEFGSHIAAQEWLRDNDPMVEAQPVMRGSITRDHYDRELERMMRENRSNC